MRNLVCAMLGHSSDGIRTYNSGYWFGACGRCAEPLVRSATSDWDAVPPGHRVVWKAGCHSHSIEPDYTGVLPIVQAAEGLPALPNPFVSWCRTVVRTGGGPAVAGGAHAEAAEREHDYRYPGLLLMAVALGAGFRMLLGLTGDR